MKVFKKIEHVHYFILTITLLLCAAISIYYYKHHLFALPPQPNKGSVNFCDTTTLTGILDNIPKKPIPGYNSDLSSQGDTITMHEIAYLKSYFLDTINGHTGGCFHILKIEKIHKHKHSNKQVYTFIVHLYSKARLRNITAKLVLYTEKENQKDMIHFHDISLVAPIPVDKHWSATEQIDFQKLLVSQDELQNEIQGMTTHQGIHYDEYSLASTDSYMPYVGSLNADLKSQ